MPFLFLLQGYTIPLDKRLAADGRGLQTVHINENFAKLAEALYIADRKVIVYLSNLYATYLHDKIAAQYSIWPNSGMYLPFYTTIQSVK